MQHATRDVTHFTPTLELIKLMEVKASPPVLIGDVNLFALDTEEAEINIMIAGTVHVRTCACLITRSWLEMQRRIIETDCMHERL